MLQIILVFCLLLAANFISTKQVFNETSNFNESLRILRYSIAITYDKPDIISNKTGTGFALKDTVYRAICFTMNCNSGCCDGELNLMKCGLVKNCQSYSNRFDNSLALILGIIVPIVFIVLIACFRKNGGTIGDRFLFSLVVLIVIIFLPFAIIYFFYKKGCKRGYNGKKNVEIKKHVDVPIGLPYNDNANIPPTNNNNIPMNLGYNAVNNNQENNNNNFLGNYQNNNAVDREMYNEVVDKYQQNKNENYNAPNSVYDNINKNPPSLLTNIENPNINNDNIERNFNNNNNYNSMNNNNIYNSMNNNDNKDSHPYDYNQNPQTINKEVNVENRQIYTIPEFNEIEENDKAKRFKNDGISNQINENFNNNNINYDPHNKDSQNIPNYGFAEKGAASLDF